MFDERLRTENSNIEAQIGRVNELKNIEQNVDSEEKQRQKLIQDLILLKKKFSFHSGSEESGSEKVCFYFYYFPCRKFTNFAKTTFNVSTIPANYNAISKT